ncbi:unnamed protein product [Parnassius apollo]|uniref:(apollo) hypothetical protein n=1 Tax=Parnassius apollo TaxID=110799 RepID=A0A8S3XYL0_PARAO|nr:unnamed protein product [Parnassius apollo]
MKQYTTTCQCAHAAATEPGSMLRKRATCRTAARTTHIQMKQYTTTCRRVRAAATEPGSMLRKRATCHTAVRTTHIQIKQHTTTYRRARAAVTEPAPCSGSEPRATPLHAQHTFK